jgi:hypothetical protein
MAFDHAAYAYRRLIAAGVHPQWAAAAVGNSAHETGWFKYPKSLVPGEHSAGYAHWNKGAGRLQPFERYMRSRGVEDYLDPQTNMDYMINEDYPKNYPKLWNQMRTAPHSMEAATKQYMETYENPAPATAGLGSRVSNAQRIYELMQRNNIPEGQMANPQGRYDPNGQGVQRKQIMEQSMGLGGAQQQQSANGNSVAEKMSTQFPNVWGEIIKNGTTGGNMDTAGNGSISGDASNTTNEMPKPSGNSKPPGYGSMGMARAGMAGLLGPENYQDVSQLAMPLIMQLITMSKTAGSLNG